MSGSNRYHTGLNPNVQLNNYNLNRVYVPSSLGDSFENNSLQKLSTEYEIRKMIGQNPGLKRILADNGLKINSNIKELDNLMHGHAQDTADIAAAIVKNLTPALRQKVDIKLLKESAMLHDFGKVLIPDEILNKPAILTPQERKIMNLHPELGYQLLKNTNVNREVLNLVRNHHSPEKAPFDINLQILSLADKYSALTEKRVYKESYSEQKALTILYSEVKKGNIHPLLFNALVKAVSPKKQTNTTSKLM